MKILASFTLILITASAMVITTEDENHGQMTLQNAGEPVFHPNVSFFVRATPELALFAYDVPTDTDFA